MNKVLELLSGGDFVSGEEMAKAMDISRTAVWKKIDALKKAGYEIESQYNRGYRLLPGDRLDHALWQGLLTSETIGRGEVLLAQEVTSTNTVLKQMGLNGAPDGSVCIAELQTAGKGRLGRVWSSPTGAGLWQSVLLRPKLPAAQVPLLTLLSAMAMVKAVEEVTGLKTEIKWPNDVILRGKKLCGILLESVCDQDSVEFVIIGCGLNMKSTAYPEEIAHRATSLAEHLETMPPRREILVRYYDALEKLVRRLENGEAEAILREYGAQCCTVGSQVQVSGSTVEFTGKALRVDDTGALIVQDAEGNERRLFSGDVSVRGVMGYV